MFLRHKVFYTSLPDIQLYSRLSMFHWCLSTELHLHNVHTFLCISNHTILYHKESCRSLPEIRRRIQSDTYHLYESIVGHQGSAHMFQCSPHQMILCHILLDNTLLSSLGGIRKYKDLLHVHSLCKFCYIRQSSFDQRIQGGRVYHRFPLKSQRHIRSSKNH